MGEDGLKSIRALLTSKYTIPAYQREYVWKSNKETDPVRVFWEDLESYSNESKIDRYLFGSMIAYTDEANTYIIDGQQRLTTIMLYLIAAMHTLGKISTNSDGTIVCHNADNYYNKLRTYVGYIHDDESEDELILSVALDNRSFYRQFLLGTGSTLPTTKTDAQKNMLDAYKFFKGKFNDLLLEKNQEEYQHTNEELAKIKKITDDLLDGFKVFYIESNNLTEAYTTFGTLNYRGKPLDQADLVKNYFFSKCNENGDDKRVEMSWNQLVNDVGTKNMTQFIRYCWVSKNPSVTKNVLFYKISKEYQTRSEVNSFIEELKGNSKLFAFCKDPKNNSNVTKNDVVKEIMINFGEMDFEIFVPLVFALYSSQSPVPEKERVLILQYLESYVLRNITIGHLGTKDIWRYIVEASHLINKDPDNYSLETIKKIFLDRKSDSAFEDDLKNFKFTDNKIPRMLLKRIYADDELRVVSDITLEHILPESKAHIKKRWPKYTEDDHLVYRYKIGNMTLLTPDDNREGSDLSFNDKKEQVFSKSKLAENIKLAEMEDWLVEDIIARGDELISEIIKKW